MISFVKVYKLYKGALLYILVFLSKGSRRSSQCGISGDAEALAKVGEFKRQAEVYTLHLKFNNFELKGLSVWLTDWPTRSFDAGFADHFF